MTSLVLGKGKSQKDKIFVAAGNQVGHCAVRCCHGARGGGGGCNGLSGWSRGVLRVTGVCAWALGPKR